MLQVTLNLEVNTDLESAHQMVDHIDWDELCWHGDDVVEVNSVEVENFQLVQYEALESDHE